MLKKILITLVVLAILGAAAAAFLSGHYNDLLEPVDPQGGEEFIVVDIPSGTNTEIIADILYHERLIKSQPAFRFYVRRNDLGQHFIAGQYRLSPGMNVEQITAKLVAGDVYSETTWFTIPEGYNIRQIASRLGEKGLVEEGYFLELAESPPAELLERFPFLKGARVDGVDYMLEGYLFPDTYEVYTETGEEAIIELMLARMEQALNAAQLEGLDEMGYTLHEVLTVASLVEREGRVDHERALIAGVFYNRLQVGQLLESCATIQYILGETKEFLTYEDLALPSPYNTYLNPGLPPGPIAAPGEPSIAAAISPEETDYFFFNYRYDESGEHYFSRTLEEHNSNVRLAEENLD